MFCTTEFSHIVVLNKAMFVKGLLSVKSFVFGFLCMLLTALNSMDAAAHMKVLSHRALMSLKRYFSMLAGLKKTNKKKQYVVWTLSETPATRKTISSHIVRQLSQCDHRSQCVSYCGLYFLLLWCSLWIVLLFWGSTSEANHRLSKPA